MSYFHSFNHCHIQQSVVSDIVAPRPCVQRTIKLSKNTVRRGVVVGHTNRYQIYTVPRPNTYLIRSEQKSSLDKAFIGNALAPQARQAKFSHALV